MDEVKNHKFFKDINWNKLLAKKVKPPYKPSMREINFSNEFTSIPVTFNFEEEITRTERIMSGPMVTPINSSHTTKAGELLNTFGDYAHKACKELGVPDHENPFKSSRKGSEPKAKSSYNSKIVKMVSDSEFVETPKQLQSVSSDGSLVDHHELSQDVAPSDKQIHRVATDYRKKILIDTNPPIEMKTLSIHSPEPEVQESPTPKPLVSKPLDKNSAKLKSEDVKVKRKLSDSERMKDSDDKRLVMKQMRTFVSSRQLQIVDIFSSNVVSERVRKDPREENQKEEFEVIHEQDSDDDSESCKIDEEANINRVGTYHSVKSMIGSSTLDNKAYNSITESKDKSSHSILSNPLSDQDDKEKSKESQHEGSTRKTSHIELLSNSKGERKSKRFIEEVIVVEYNDLEEEDIDESVEVNYLLKFSFILLYRNISH